MFENNLILKTASQMHLLHIDIANITSELVRNIFSCLSFNSLYHTGGSVKGRIGEAVVQSFWHDYATATITLFQALRQKQKLVQQRKAIAIDNILQYIPFIIIK